MILNYKKSVFKDLRDIPKADQKKILDFIENKLRISPDKGEKLVGNLQGQMKIRVGNYRIIYVFNLEEVLVLRVGHRKDVYRD